MKPPRPKTELDDMAERIAAVLNAMAPKLPIEPHDVDLRMVAELCWALDITPEIAIQPSARRALATPPGGRQ